jgi:hypothetical protein
MITPRNCLSDSTSGSNINTSFAENLTKVFNTIVIPEFPTVTKFSVEQGLFTSGEYGSYRVPCFDKDGNMLCYIVCDVILGEYIVYSGKYNNDIN